METVYLETTFISYLVSLPSRDLVVAAHQHLSNKWWFEQQKKYKCYVSEVVIQEASAGDPVESRKRLDILDDIELLQITNNVILLTELIVESKALPPKALRDAAHVAVAAVHNIDFLLTWNCKHLANAHIIKQIERVCARSGFSMPVICTPEALME